jgi:lipopolysaccharide transport system permease protein
MWATPVVYSSEHLGGFPHWVYGLNPMAGVVEGFRWAIAGTPRFPPLEVFIGSVLISAVLFATGLVYFNRMEESFADVA